MLEPLFSSDTLSLHLPLHTSLPDAPLSLSLSLSLPPSLPPSLSPSLPLSLSLSVESVNQSPQQPDSCLQRSSTGGAALLCSERRTRRDPADGAVEFSVPGVGGGVLIAQDKQIAASPPCCSSFSSEKMKERRRRRSVCVCVCVCVCVAASSCPDTLTLQQQLTPAKRHRHCITSCSLVPTKMGRG